MSMTRREVLLALADCVGVEYLYSDGWGDIPYTSLKLESSNNWEPERWRLKSVAGKPLSPTTCPTYFWVRCKNEHHDPQVGYLVVGVRPLGIYTIGCDGVVVAYTWAEAAEELEMSVDRKEWHAMWKDAS